MRVSGIGGKRTSSRWHADERNFRHRESPTREREEPKYFTGYTPSGIYAFLKDSKANALIMPTLDHSLFDSTLGPVLTNQAQTVIREFVSGGGGYINVGDSSAYTDLDDTTTGYNTALMSSIFDYGGFATSDFYGNRTNNDTFTLDNTAATGTPFTNLETPPDNVNSDPAPNSGTYFLTDLNAPVTLAGKKLYNLAVNSDGINYTETDVDVLPYAGRSPVAYLGRTWADGGPNGAQNNNWPQILDDAIKQVAGTAVLPSITVTPPTAQTFEPGVSKTFNLGGFTESGATGPYSVDINWGDREADTTEPASGQGTLMSKPHTFVTDVPQTVTVTVTDASTVVVGSDSFTIQPATVTVIPPAAQTATQNVKASFNLGLIDSENTTGPYAVSLNWEDGTTTSFQQNATDADTIDAQFHTFVAAGTHPVQVTVTDSTGTISGSATFDVTVAGPTLTLTPPAAATAIAGVSQSFVLGDFTDLGGTAPFALALDWGDHTGSSKQPSFSAAGMLSASHTYAAAGTYTATVTVTDSSTPAATATTTFEVTVTAGSTASTVALQADPTSVVTLQPVSLTATLGSAAATGVVTFEQNGQFIGTAVVANGMATLTTTGLTVGTDTITALYGGDATYDTSTSPAVTVVVLPPPVDTTITVAASAPSISSSESVTLTATVVPITSNGVALSGTVTFFSGSDSLGTVDVGANGVVTLVTTSPLAVGSASISAQYNGNSAFNAATTAAPAVVVVVPTATTIQLSVADKSKTLDQQTTLVATVGLASTPALLAGAVATGTVTFSVAGTTVGTAPVGADGRATLVVAGQAPLGIVKVTAAFVGDSGFAASTSGSTTITVVPHALVPTVRRVVVPPTVVAGAPIRASVLVTVVNQLSGATLVSNDGAYVVRLYASVTGTLDVATDTVIATTTEYRGVPVGGRATVELRADAFPATLAGGTYHLVVETVDISGNAESVDTGTSVVVRPLTAALTATFVTPADQVAGRSGATVSLADVGDGSYLAGLTATVGFSTDAAGAHQVATAVGTVQPNRRLIRSGTAVPLHVNGWRMLLAGLPSGTYYATLTLTDDSGHTATVVGRTAIQH